MEDKKIPVFDIMHKGEKVAVVLNPFFVDPINDFLNSLANNAASADLEDGPWKFAETLKKQSLDGATAETVNTVRNSHIDMMAHFWDKCRIRLTGDVKELEAQILSFRKTIEVAAETTHDVDRDSGPYLLKAFDEHFGIETQKEGKVAPEDLRSTEEKYFEILEKLPDNAFVRDSLASEFAGNKEEALRNIIEYLRRVAKKESIHGALTLLKEIAYHNMTPETYSMVQEAVKHPEAPYIIKLQP